VTVSPLSLLSCVCADVTELTLCDACQNHIYASPARFVISACVHATKSHKGKKILIICDIENLLNTT
jgi:hypothetical protein